MKRTNQTRSGNVTGTGHGFKGIQPSAYVPRHEPLPRQFRRILKAIKRSTAQTMPKWAIMSTPLDYMFRRAGLMVAPESGAPSQ